MVKEGRQTPFAQVREQLLAEQEAADRERMFNDVTGKLVDQVYRNPTSLSEAAAAVGLEVKTSGRLVRGAVPGGLFSNPAVQRAAFSDVLVQDGTVSDPIEIAPNHSVLIRVVEHQTGQVVPMAEVGGRVIAAIRRDRAARAAEAAAEAMLEEIRAGKSFAEVAEAHQLAVTEMPGMPRGM